MSIGTYTEIAIAKIKQANQKAYLKDFTHRMMLRGKNVTDKV